MGEGSGVKWLIMPWQPLVTSDRAVLTSVEESLVNSHDINLIVHTCQFVTDVMLQDFPAEIFLQRPSMVLILQAILKGNRTHESSIVQAAIKTIHKLTRSLRYRTYYYSDPAVVSKRPNALFAQSEGSWSYESSLDDRITPEGGVPEGNYQAYQQQCTGSQDSPYMIGTNIDDAILRQSQMTIPIYCMDMLNSVLSLFNEYSIVDGASLKIVKNILELSSELVDLLVTSLTLSMWLETNKISLSITENLKSLLQLMGDLLEYFIPNNLDDNRIIYLQILRLITIILSSLVPLELSDIIIPKNLKVSLCQALLDAPIFLLNPELSSTLEQYARHFNDSETTKLLEIFDEIREASVSFESAISLISSNSELSNMETLRLMWSAKSTLACHKHLSLVTKYITFLQEANIMLENEEKDLAERLLLDLLSNVDEEIRTRAYEECRELVTAALGVEAKSIGKYAWIKVAFLLNARVMTEIICHGIDGDNETIRNIAEDILIYILKGKIHVGHERWTKLLDDAVIPTMGLLQCLADTNSPLGHCITKMLDPDVYESIQIPYIEVVRGNTRLLFSSNVKLREEATCRLIFLLGCERDSSKKLPRLSSLHGLPLSSLCIIERSCGLKRSEGNYQTNSLLSVLELLRTPEVEPKVRKSALTQISVMLTDSSLHRIFIRENGLTLILDILEKSLIEREYENYPDSIIPILTILKIITTTQTSVRHDLSTRSEVYFNILRGLFLFPNNENVRIDASQLLCFLLYSEYMKIRTDAKGSCVASLPRVIINKMRLSIGCKSHWKTSQHQRPEIGIVMSKEDSCSLTFLRQFWFWTTNGSVSTALYENFENVEYRDISKNLAIRNDELILLRRSSVRYSVNEQLVDIQNSTMHCQVIDSLDRLSLYLRFWKMGKNGNDGELKKLPWKQTFVRFLLSQPTNKEDCELFVDVVNFLYTHINIVMSEGDWLGEIIRKNVTRSLSDLYGTMNSENQKIHEAVLKLVRSASAIEEIKETGENSGGNSWMNYIELIVTNLCFGDQAQDPARPQHEKQQHFYNLAYLDWLLRCLTHLTSKQQNWNGRKDLLTTLGNALVELIISFHGAGNVSFMGLSITRNSIICLNHLSHEMRRNFGKKEFNEFWYDEERTLGWLTTLWKNRDPLVRASAFQLLAGLTRLEHTGLQLLRTLTLAPSELCDTLIRYFTNRDECCLVREQACIALGNLVKNSANPSFQYMDSLKTSSLVIYIEQSNVYYEISVVCSNVYLGASLDPEQRDATFEGIEDMGNLDEGDENYRNSVATPALVTVICTLLNNLIIAGGEDVAKNIYEQSLDKYFLGCFDVISPYEANERTNFVNYCDILEMYTSLCTLMTNCITHCEEFATIANFSSETLCLVLKYLEKENYLEDGGRVESLRKSLSTEVYNFLSVLSLTENGEQHMEAVIRAKELSGPRTILTSICRAMKDSRTELRSSSISCLASLLTLEIKRTSEESNDDDKKWKNQDFQETSLSSILDNCLVVSSDSRQTDVEDNSDYQLRQVISSLNRLSVAANNTICTSVNTNEKQTSCETKNVPLGSEISKILIHLFIAHNYATSGKDRGNMTRDKDIVIGALSNLLCVSMQAKRTALDENLGETCLMILKEFHKEFTLQPYQIYKTKTSRQKKVYPLLNETKRILELLINFTYDSVEIKDRLAKAGLADSLHKLWAWIFIDDRTVTSALELIATFTTNCSEATHSLILTNALHGTGLRTSSNSSSLLNAIINLIGREIDKAGRNFDNQKLHFAFHALRNVVHVHECRVAVSKSNLLQLLIKIHPATTRRVKPWPLLEVYCLEFLNDFTFYEEGQVSVAKAPDGLDVLIELARSSTPTTRLLAISTLRNLVFNSSNRPRLLASVPFMNLLRWSFENGTFNEIGITGSILWSLVSNNQKSKLRIRSAGFSHAIQEVIGRLSLLSTSDDKQRQDLTKILHYVVRILSSFESAQTLK